MFFAITGFCSPYRGGRDGLRSGAARRAQLRNWFLIDGASTRTFLIMALREVVIRDAVGGYVVADPVTRRALAGPFSSLADATTQARRFVPCGQVWREAADRQGRSLGRFLLELRASTIE